jgi:hypothetical protein
MLVGKPAIFGKPTFAYLDAGESATRRYMAFLARVPKDFGGVSGVSYREGRIIIRERGASSREITINAGTLF